MFVVSQDHIHLFLTPRANKVDPNCCSNWTADWQSPGESSLLLRSKLTRAGAIKYAWSAARLRDGWRPTLVSEGLFEFPSGPQTRYYFEWTNCTATSFGEMGPCSFPEKAWCDKEASINGPSEIYSRNNPYMSTVLVNRLLSGPASEKETRHIELSLGSSGIEYLPGDSAGVVPQNRSDAVEEILRLLDFIGDEPVKDFYGGALDLREALTSWLMIGKLSTSTVRGWAKITGNEELADLLLPENKKSFENYLWGREFLDLLEQYPARLEDAQQLFKLLPRLAPRLYSISSSQALYPSAVHLSIRVVLYETHRRKRQGVCSGQIGERTPEGDALPIFIHSNRLFRLPENLDAPVIMVGPGTGVAPFRAFLQHKQAGCGRWPMWLFFGEQRESEDFLYRDENLAWLESGVLTRLDTAFSRDQDEKIYVQHRIRERSAELWRWLEGGAYFYVCGDSKYMAPDVEAAVRQAIAVHSGKGEEYADEFLAGMKKQKRYLKDVY